MCRERIPSPYVRVSSQRQATEGDSPVAHEHEIEREVEFCKRRENWQIESMEFYVDAGKGAKDQNRPQLQRLMRDIAAGIRLSTHLTRPISSGAAISSPNRR